MTHYRLYYLDAYGGRLHAVDLDCVDDDHARQTVTDHPSNAARELRQGARLVARFAAYTNDPSD